MPRVSAAFFLFGALCALTGMFWGMHMGATENFQLAPAHAHLNLLGWVTMALYGTFYALTAQTLSRGLAWTNFVLSAAGALILIPPLAMFLATADKSLIPIMVVGEVLTVLGLVTFLISVWRELFRQRA
jgi:hypothetical protein